MFIKILKKRQFKFLPSHSRENMAKKCVCKIFLKIFDFSINYPVKLHDFRRARVRLQIEERAGDIAEVHR